GHRKRRGRGHHRVHREERQDGQEPGSGGGMRPQRISRKGRALSPRGVAAALTTIALFAASDAFAFEREWHLGGGVGASDFSAEGVGWGPELGVHGAYGLSDSFDLRL